MKLRDIDMEWLSVVAVGMTAHFRNSCVVGFCGDSALADFRADLPSALFTFSVLTFMADNSWFPLSLKKPHALVGMFFHVLLALAVSNGALKLLWIPLQGGLLNAALYINSQMQQKTSKDFLTICRWMDDNLLYVCSMVVSLAFIGTQFFTTGVWDMLRQNGLRFLRRRRGRILLLPAGSLARMRALAPRYVLRKVDESEDEDEQQQEHEHGHGPLAATPAPASAVSSRTQSSPGLASPRCSPEPATSSATFAGRATANAASCTGLADDRSSLAPQQQPQPPADIAPTRETYVQ